MRSASRRGKSAARFQFDFTVDRIFGSIIRPGNSYYVKWTRGAKVAQTKPRTAEKEHAGGSKSSGGLPFGYKMSLLVTLYRESESGPGSMRFDEKDFKLTLISLNSKGNERTVAKLHFDLSQYAGVPSASHAKVFQMSEKASIKATIDARFSKSGASGPGSGGASSALSGMIGTSANSSDDDQDQNGDDDFGDLDVSSVPEPEIPLAAPSSLSNSSSSRDAASRRNSSGKVNIALSSGATGESNFVVDSRRKQFGSAGVSSRDDETSSSQKASHPPLSSAGFIAKEIRKQASGHYDRDDTTFMTKTLAAERSASGGISNEILPNKNAMENDEVVRLRKELQDLEKEHEKVIFDLRRAQDKRKRIESAHETEMTALREQVAMEAKSSSEKFSYQSTADSRRIEELTARAEEISRELRSVTVDRDTIRGEAEQLRVSALEADKLREQNRALSRDIDRLTVAAASSGAGGGLDSNDVQERLAKLQAEKDSTENKLRAHQTHAAKVKEAYQKLSDMYNQLRNDNVDMQSKIEALEQEKHALDLQLTDQKQIVSKGGFENSSGGNSASACRDQDVVELKVQLADALRAVEDVKTSKTSLQRDHDRLAVQVESYQERLDKLSEEVEEARAEADNLHAEAAQLAMERDSAVQRALKTTGSAGGFDEAKYSEAQRARELSEREVIRMRQRLHELEREVTDAVDELEYERSEKVKAREERDALRESARALERRTSQVSQTADAVHSLKRQLSAHKMRDADQTAMIADLRDEIDNLRSELDGRRGKAGTEVAGIRSFGGKDAMTSDADVVEDLVMTKLALATAEDEKLELQFALKNLKKGERAVQERLAAHASELEVKLSEANEEVQRLREKYSDDTSLV